MIMKVAVIGSGIVGEVLSNGFLKYGYTVIRASRDPAKLQGWLDNANNKASTATLPEASAEADMIVLSVAGGAALEAIEQCGVENLKGKIVVDTTNPIGGPPEDGVLKFFAGTNDTKQALL